MIKTLFQKLAGFALFLILAVVAAMFATNEATYLESDGDALNVTLLEVTSKNDVIYADGWLGIACDDGVSGEEIALDVSPREYQFTVPAGLTVNKGDTVYITVATVTIQTPDDAAYTTTAGAGKIALFKATAAKDANNVVTGILRSKFN